MNRIRFILEQYHPDWGSWEGIIPVVDDISFLKLVDDFESSKGWDAAGAYAGIDPAFTDAKRWIRSLLGDGHPEYEGMECTWLLGCGCSVAGCWPFEARVMVEADIVTWKLFRQPFRPERDYSGFGPFVFDRREYEAAIQELAQTVAQR
jgi:hypothetical protein